MTTQEYVADAPSRRANSLSVWVWPGASILFALLSVAANNVRMRAMQLQLDLGGLGEATGLATARSEALLAVASQLFLALLVVTLLVTVRAILYPRTPAAIRVGTLVAVLVSIAWMFRQIV